MCLLPDLVPPALNQNRGLICRAGPYKELPVCRELSPVTPFHSNLGARISRDRHPPRQDPAPPVAPPPAMKSTQVEGPAPISTLRRHLHTLQPPWLDWLPLGLPSHAEEVFLKKISRPVERCLIQEPPGTEWQRARGQAEHR